MESVKKTLETRLQENTSAEVRLRFADDGTAVPRWRRAAGRGAAHDTPAMVNSVSITLRIITLHSHRSTRYHYSIHCNVIIISCTAQHSLQCGTQRCKRRT